MLTENSDSHEVNNTFILKIVVSVVALLKFLEVLTPMAHGDALYYHLPVAKQWIEFGFLEMHKELAGSLQAGIFDYLYLIPVGLFGANLYGQLAAQLMYFLCSIGLATFLVIKALHPNSILKSLFILYMITYGVDSDFFIFAKNDGVLASFGLLATLEFSQNFISKRFNQKWELLIKGATLGILPLIKINGLLICVVLGIYFIWKKKNIKHFFVITLISFILALPLFIRNYYFLASPFYPGLLGLFPGKLTSPMIAFYKASMQSPITLQGLLFHLKAFTAFKLINIFIVLYLVKVKKIKFSDELLVSIVIFIIYLILNGGVPAARFYFICFFLNSYFILSQFEKFNISRKVLFLLVLLILSDSKIDKSFGRIKKSLLAAQKSNSSLEFVNNTIMQTRVWNYVEEENKKIITDDFLEIYYAPRGTRLYHYKQSVQAFHLYRCSDEFGDLAKLNEYDYAFLNHQFGIRNKCTEYIRNNFELKYKEDHYEVYKRVSHVE